MFVLKDDLRRHLLRACPEEDLKRWFDPLDMEIIEPIQVFSVAFPHVYFAQWFTDNVQNFFEEQVGRFIGQGYILQYNCRNAGQRAKGLRAFAESTASIDFPFGHQFTFESFFVNEKNYFPLALAKEISKNGEIKYNPFIICGPSGSGKTHLLRSMANEIARQNAKERSFLGGVDDLNNIFTVKFPGDRYKARKYLESFKWLFVDDFQNIKKYKELEQDLIILFNVFHDNAKQMIFCSADKVSNCNFLDPTLKSRLEWGLMVNLKMPDLDVRVRFVENHCRRKKLSLTKDQILTLARRFESLRSLSGMLLRFDAFREHVHGDISEKDFKRLILLSDEKKIPEITSDQILTAVSAHFQIPVKDLLGNKRHKNVAFARQVAMTLCRQLLGISYPALGNLFGGKDHSTVLYSIRKINKLQTDDRDTKNMLADLSKKCRQGSQA